MSNGIAIFGSYARGDNADDSDIDLRYEADELDLGSHSDIVDVLTSRFKTKVDLLSTDSIRGKEFLKRIQGDEVLLYEDGLALYAPLWCSYDVPESNFSYNNSITLKRH